MKVSLDDIFLKVDSLPCADCNMVSESILVYINGQIRSICWNCIEKRDNEQNRTGTASYEPIEVVSYSKQKEEVETNHAKVIKLHLEGQSVRKIASALGLSPSAVQGHIERFKGN